MCDRLVVAAERERRIATPARRAVVHHDEHTLLLDRNEQRKGNEACCVAKPSGERVVEQDQRAIASC